jgi:hypothetical protein
MTDTDWTNDAPETIGEALADKHLRIIKEAVTMTPTDDRLATNELAEIEALAKGVTPGPWEPASGATYEDGKPVITEWFVRRPDDDVAIAADILDPETIKPSEANAKFIARARTAVPGLLAHIRAQDAELARLLDEREEPYRILADIRDALLGQPGDPLCDRWLGATVGDAGEIPGLAQDRQAERDTLVAANARLRDALAALVDAEAHGTPGGYIGVDPSGETHDRHCTYCYTFWRMGEPERHDDDCPVAVARVLLDGADTPGEGGA